MNKNIPELYASGKDMNFLHKTTGLPVRKIKKLILKSGGRIRNVSECHRKYSMDEHVLDNLDSADKFYFLGWFASDGSIFTAKDTMALQVQIDDIQILENIKKICKSNHPIKIIRQAGRKVICGVECNIKDAARLDLHSKILVARLRELGFTSNKSEDLSFPTWVPDAFLADFTRGYWEGDGSLFGAGRNSVVTVASTFAFSSILLGKLSSILGMRGLLDRKNNTYVICIGGNTQCLKFLNFIYADAEYVLPRKYQKYQSLVSALRENPRTQLKTRLELARATCR